MDRNNVFVAAFIEVPRVALLAEGVDRNAPAAVGKYRTMVALLAEGVDRNEMVFLVTATGD